MKELIAKRLISLRGDDSREETAQAVGISVSALQMYENGQRVPRDEIKIKLASHYKRTVQSIFLTSNNTKRVLLKKEVRETMAVPLEALHTHTLRGDVMVQQSRMDLPEANIVETYQFGESKVHICDNYVAQTPEAIQKVLKNLHAKGWDIALKLREQGIEV